MIYLKLKGRIGNQLFMYAAARALQKATGNVHEIMIEDNDNVAHDNSQYKYENSLIYYNLPNVRFIHNLTEYHKIRMLIKRLALAYIRYKERNKNSEEIRKFEREQQVFFNSLGIFYYNYGYYKVPNFNNFKNIYLEGYFQSEKFFCNVREEIIKTFSLKGEIEESNYKYVNMLENRNSVCISIKVQHNIGNPRYDVCGKDYYKKAIEYMVSQIDSPLFFVCSDNIDYVMKNILNLDGYDVIVQDSNYPVQFSLAVMACCKHFIINNTSFGWWAQYLSNNTNKIVIVPSRWYNNTGDWQYDIYQSTWKIIEV